MADAVTPPQVVAPAAAPPPAPTLEDNLNTALSAAPDLVHSPALAVDVASGGGDVGGRAQGVAQAAKTQLTAQAVNATTKAIGPAGGNVVSQILGWFGHNVVRNVATIGSDALRATNAPLQFVQREYRYLHDVEARHGLLAAVGEGAVIAGAGVAGAVAGGGLNLETGALAAEGATAALGQVAYHDSWNAAGNPNYVDPHTHQKVSFGRDIAGGLLHLKAGSGAYGAFSGLFDALGDLTADPLAVGGRLSALRYSDTGGSILGKQYAGTLLTADRIQPAYDQLPRVTRAIDALAAAQTPADVLRIDRRWEPMAAQLAAARTPDEVIDQLKAASTALESNSMKSIPTLSLPRVATSRLRQIASNMDRGVSDAIKGNGTSRVRGALGNVASAFSPRAWADRTERVPGRSFDPNEMKFSGKKIDPTNANGVGANDLWAMARYGLGSDAADHIVNMYYAADTRGRISLIRNTILNSMVGMSGHDLPLPGETAEDYLKHTSFEDPAVRKHIAEFLDHYVHTGDPDVGNAYGASEFGKPIPGVVDKDTGVGMGAAVDTLQSGHITLPNFHDMKRMGQMIEGGKHLFSTLDDFGYNHITQKFFKPLVLQSIGYALHISLAEVIPNVLRQGFRDTIRGHFQAAYARLSYKAADGDELNGLEAWAWRHIAQMPAPLQKRVLGNEKDLGYLADLGVLTNGAGITTGVSAGENIGAEINKTDRYVSTMRKGVAQATFKGSKTFATFGPEESPRRLQEWQVWLRRISKAPEHQVAASAYLKSLKAGRSTAQASNDAWIATTKHLDDLPNADKANWLRTLHKTEDSPESWTPTQDWAHQIVQNVKGATHSGTTHEPHQDLLYGVANGKVPKLGRLRNLVTSNDGPLKVPGRVLVPDGTGTIQRIANVGFQHVLNPMVNLLSRDATFAIEYMKIRRGLQDAVEGGVLSNEQAATLAASRATSESIRFIHNIHDRTQWAETTRNWAPFYFAQEQAYRRAGRLLASNPGAFRQYQMEIMGVHDMTVQQQDGQGNRYIAFPGSGFLTGTMVDGIGSAFGQGLSGVSPAGIGGTLSSANVIFPLSEGVRPGWGPVVLIPAKAIYSKFTELAAQYPAFAPVGQPVASGISNAIGSSAVTEDMWKEFVPNTFIQRVIEAGQGNDRAFQSSVMQTMAALAYQQNKAEEAWIKGGSHGPPPQIIPGPDATPHELQVFQSRVTNQTRIAYGIRAIAGFFSPVSANVEVNNYGLSAELTQAITKAGSVSAGMQAFLEKNPDATPYTVAQSYVPTGGSLPASQEAENWIQSNQTLINQYPTAAAWLMPQLTDNTYNPSVYNEQLAAGLRVKRSPSEFLDQLYIAAADQTYYNALAQHEAALGVPAGGGPATLKGAAAQAEYQKWDSYVADLGASNPIWYANLLSGQKQINAQTTIKDLNEIFASGKQPPGQQSDLVQELLTSYNSAAADWANASASYDYSTQEKQVKAQWASYLGQMSTDYPQLAPIISSVFRDVFYARTT